MISSSLTPLKQVQEGELQFGRQCKEKVHISKDAERNPSDIRLSESLKNRRGGGGVGYWIDADKPFKEECPTCNNTFTITVHLGSDEDIVFCPICCTSLFVEDRNLSVKSAGTLLTEALKKFKKNSQLVALRSVTRKALDAMDAPQNKRECQKIDNKAMRIVDMKEKKIGVG